MLYATDWNLLLSWAQCRGQSQQAPQGQGREQHKSGTSGTEVPLEHPHPVRRQSCRGQRVGVILNREPSSCEKIRPSPTPLFGQGRVVSKNVDSSH